MTLNGFLQLGIYFLVLLALTKPLGVYMTKVFSGERIFLGRIFGPLERLIYRICRIDEHEEQHWTAYTAAMLMFSLVGLLVSMDFRDFNTTFHLIPKGFPVWRRDLAFNTASSFTTNTNWQAYSGESTMSYLVQWQGWPSIISFQQPPVLYCNRFHSGIARRETMTLGNFWVDLTRTTLYVLLPFCIIGALLLVSQGVVQNFRPYTQATLVEPQQWKKRMTVAIRLLKL